MIFVQPILIHNDVFLLQSNGTLNGVSDCVCMQRRPARKYQLKADNHVRCVFYFRHKNPHNVCVIVFLKYIQPGPLGWLGNLLVVIGTLAVVYPSMGKGGSQNAH